VLDASGSLSGTAAYSYFAVYDGHSGTEASSYLETQLHLLICKHAEFLTDTHKAVQESCVLADKLFLVRLDTTSPYFLQFILTYMFMIGYMQNN
jgi:serine/threonine protein phosphatase PrpC